MSTNDAVFQRRNKQIEDAIDAQNLKQALQLIEKRIKKGEDTPFLKVCLFIAPRFYYVSPLRSLLYLGA
jgi:hypothetical protein